MRPGRPFKFRKYDTFHSEGGVLDRFNFKSIFFSIKTTVVSIEEEDRMRNLKNLHFRVRQTLNKYNSSGLFKKNFISVPVIHETFEETGKAFTQFDYTLFLDKEAMFPEIEKEVVDIIDKIYIENFRDNKSFEFINHNWRLSRKKQLENVKGRKVKRVSQSFLWEEEESSKKVIQ